MAGRLATGLAAALAAALLPGIARAAPFPTRGGEVGLLDVPTADTAGTAGGLVGGELRLDRTPGQPAAVGPLPLSLVFGLSDRLDGGLAMREGGEPGDRAPAVLVFSAATKLRLHQASGLWPALAASVTLDSFNLGGVLGGRLVASTAEIGRLRFAAFAGAEGHGPRPVAVGPTAGLAVSVTHRSDLETVLEATTSPRGPLVGGAFRWSVTPKVGVSLGLSWLPDQGGFRVSLGFGLAAAPPRRARPRAAPAEAPPAPPPAAPLGPTFLDDRPHFRMRIASAATRVGEHRHLQHGPFSDAGRLSPTARPARIERADPEALRAAELALAAETLDGRAKRLRSAEGALASRQERQAAESSQLDRQERELARLGDALDARERQLRAPGRPSPAEISLADTEDKLRASESQAASLETSLREDARRALARERELAGRERELEPAGTAAQKLLEGRAAQPVAARGAAVDARRALLEATEARLSAARDRLEIGEKGIEARAARLELTRRRLAAKEERLAAVQRRAAGRSAAPPLPAAPAAAPQAPAAGASATMLAATVILLPSADRPLAARDRDAVAEMARLAAREKVELLIWARAQNPGLMETAARRAEEIKGVAAAAGLPVSQIGTRVTLRPSTEGVDVVVSPVRAPAPPAGGAR